MLKKLKKKIQDQKAAIDAEQAGQSNRDAGACPVRVEVRADDKAKTGFIVQLWPHQPWGELGRFGTLCVMICRHCRGTYICGGGA